jgi:hypothetical protein
MSDTQFQGSFCASARYDQVHIFRKDGQGLLMASRLGSTRRIIISTRQWCPVSYLGEDVGHLGVHHGEGRGGRQHTIHLTTTSTEAPMRGRIRQ